MVEGSRAARGHDRACAALTHGSVFAKRESHKIVDVSRNRLTKLRRGQNCFLQHESQIAHEKAQCLRASGDQPHGGAADVLNAGRKRIAWKEVLTRSTRRRPLRLSALPLSLMPTPAVLVSSGVWQSAEEVVRRLTIPLQTLLSPSRKA